MAITRAGTFNAADEASDGVLRIGFIDSNSTTVGAGTLTVDGGSVLTLDDPDNSEDPGLAIGRHLGSFGVAVVTGAMIVNGGAGNDLLRGGLGLDRFDGGIGNDRLDGGGGNDVLIGGIGNDVLIGGIGNDRLDGGLGNDQLDGGVGNDVLIGGLGLDRLVGGAGRDIFDFNAVTESLRGSSRDVVTFVRRDGDKIDLRDIDADTDGTAGNQAFKFIGATAFSGVDGQLRFAGGILQGDTNGDRRADFEIKIVGALLAGDVIL